MIVLKDIYLFLEQELGINAKALKPDSDLFEDFGVVGVFLATIELINE
jgi:hypothetical protein